MKKILNIFFIIVFILATAILSSFAQTPQYYNLNTGASSNAHPFGQSAGKAVNSLFLAGEFNQPSALPSCKQITKVYFRMATAGTGTYSNLRILMAQSSITTFTSGSFYSGPYDTVYFNASVSLTSTVGGWMGVTLNKPFIYDPSKSLILFVGQCVNSGTNINVFNSSLSGIRRIWSVGGCPYTPSSGGDASILNFGVDVEPAFNGSYSIPGSMFPTISSAISALNLNTCGMSGPVIFNVAAGYTETAPSGGFVLGSATLNASTSSTNKIIFQKSGSGSNPLVTAPVGTSTTTDGIWKIQGTDYVTINGIDIQESSANISTTTQMELGYALLKLSETDGCQYDTIKNCNITLSKSPVSSKGIYAANHTISSTTELVLTSATGANSYNKIFSNTITKVYYGIYFNGSSDANYYDLNNYIGFASGSGNTISDFAGGAGIAYGIYTGYQGGLYISYNTISGASGNTNTIYGIYTGTGINSTLSIRYNNITLTPSAGAYGIYNNLGGTGTSNTVYIYNNTVQNCSSTGFSGIANFADCSSLNIYSNQVINNDISTTSECHGIYTPGDADNQSIYSNTISGNTNSSTGTTYGICNFPAVTTNSNIYQNSIYTISSVGRVYGILTNSSNTLNIYRNNIYDLSTTATSNYIYGINLLSVTTANIYNNFISDINTPSTSVDLASSGIYLNSSVTTANIFYNTIFLNESSTGTNFGTACIYTSTTPTVDMRDNILVNISTSNGTGKTVAYRRSSSTLTTYSSNSNNNCFYAGTPGTNRLLFYDGTNSKQTIKEYRTWVSPRDASSFRENPPFINASTTPYNLHLNTTDTIQCENGGVSVSTPISVTNDYDNNTRSATPDVGADEFAGIRDIYSPVIVYTYLSNTSSTSNYTTSNFATIYDKSEVDIVSGTAPRLYYKKSTHNNSYTDNTSATNGWKWVEATNTTSPFNFTIDYSKLFGGTVTLGDSIMYFVVAQDMVVTPNVSIQSGTFASAPSSVALTSAAFPISGTINSYTICSSSPLAGDYSVSLALFNMLTGKNLFPKQFTRKVTKEVPLNNINQNENLNNSKGISGIEKDEAQNNDVKEGNTLKKIETKEIYFALSENGVEYKGPAYVEFTPEMRHKYNITDNFVGNYASISTAIRDLNTVGISASVRFMLLDANYGDAGTPESFPIIINSVAGASASKTITIRPSTGITSTVSGSSSTAIFQLYGADYLTIDGSNSGGIDKNLTITNTNAAASTTAIWLSSLGTGAGATYNTIKNCNIFCGSITNMTYAISLSASSTPGSGGADNDYNTIQNNSISKAYHALRLFGASVGYIDGVVVTGNTIGSNTASNYITNYGIRANYLSGATITNNEIFNMISENNRYGMNFAYTNNSLINKNRIHGFNHANTSNYYCVGLYFGSSSSDNQIDNNLIYDLLNYGSTSDSYLLGIQVASGNNYKLYFNSVSLTGAFRNTAANLYSKCLYVSSASTNLDIRNNVFSNTMTGTSPKTYTIDVVASSTFTGSNYNNFYTTGTVFGKYAGTERTTFADWKTATSQDAYSVSGDPGFTSNTNLIPNPSNANSWVLSGNGIHIASVTTDITGANRPADVSAGAPDIGAYEFTASESSSTPNTYSITPVTGVNDVFVNGRKLISLNFTALGGISSIGTQFYSGVPPPRRNNYPTAQFMNGYFVVTPTGGSSFTYDITYFYSEPQRGTIVSEDNIRLSKNDGNLIWTAYTDIGYGQGQYQINTTLNTIDVFGLNSFSTFSNSDKDAPLPVELASFTSSINGRDVILNWKTDKEINNAGFEIERTLQRDGGQAGEWEKVGFLSGNGTKNTPTDYSFNDKKLNTGKYNYRLKQIDYNGNIEYHNLSATVEIGVPKKYEISQNYPNPFNPVTKIDFDLPFDSKVSIKLYDISGREIKILVNETKQAGYYTTEFNGSNISSGTYFYRIIAEGNGQKFVVTKKALLIK
jgi:trimeric autotransporter adhesin